MKISLDSLYVLHTIEKNGSFTSAAKELNRVPSAISYTVNQLELDLKVTLFDRSGYRAKLTSAGQLLLKEGLSLLGQAQNLERKVKLSAGLAPSNLSIAYDDALGFEGIQQILHLSFETLPEISIDLSAEILNGNKDALISGTADLVIGCFTEIPTEFLYHYELLGQIPFVFAVAPHHPLAQVQEPLTPKVISEHRIVVIPDTAKNIPKISSGYIFDHLYLAVGSMDNKIRAQVKGIGVGFLPFLLVKPLLEKGVLIQKEVERPKPDGRCYLAWREDRTNPTLERIIDLFRQHKQKLFLV